MKVVVSVKPRGGKQKRSGRYTQATLSRKNGILRCRVKKNNPIASLGKRVNSRQPIPKKKLCKPRKY